jgi:hypothetical protein
MCANPNAKLPEVFYGRMLFMAESTDAEGLLLRPTFATSPTGGGKVPAFGRLYRQMEKELKGAVAEIEAARALVPPRCRMPFQAEEHPIRWFYHTARTEANFYEGCQLRDRILSGQVKGPEERQKALDRWLEVLKDERDNAAAALPVMEADSRLDFYFGGDHTYSHGADMLRAKLKLIDQEITGFLPSLRK